MMVSHWAKAMIIGIALILLVQLGSVYVLSEEIKQCKPEKELEVETSFKIVRGNKETTNRNEVI